MVLDVIISKSYANYECLTSIVGSLYGMLFYIYTFISQRFDSGHTAAIHIRYPTDIAIRLKARWAGIEPWNLLTLIQYNINTENICLFDKASLLFHLWVPFNKIMMNLHFPYSFYIWSKCIVCKSNHQEYNFIFWQCYILSTQY